MDPIQPGITAPVPKMARYLFFSLLPEVNPSAALAELGSLTDGRDTVVGLGSSVPAVLGTAVDGLRSAAAAHQRLISELTARFAGIRQEEHRLFLETVAPDGVRIRRLVEEGLFPPDAYVSFDSVGAIPFLSGVRVLDRLGLTDAHVARGETSSQLMAHEKEASFEYAASRGVDLWAVDYVHLFWNRNSSQFWNTVFYLRSRGDEAYAAEVGDDTMLLVELPRGITETRRRFPRLRFYSIHDEALLRMYIAR